MLEIEHILVPFFSLALTPHFAAGKLHRAVAVIPSGFLGLMLLLPSVKRLSTFEKGNELPSSDVKTI